MTGKPTPPISRRALLRQTACGFGVLGLADLLASSTELLAAAPPADNANSKPSHFSARAKRVIFLFMHGGPSHVDTFDPKPRLDRDHGKPIPFERSLSFGPEDVGGMMKSPFEFQPYGESGIPVSSLFSRVAAHVDDLCVIRSMVGDGIDHGAATLQLHTGTRVFTRPSLGSWILYGLGTENRNLPGFVTIKPTFFHGGARNWHSAFLPGIYQGTTIGNSTVHVDELRKTPIEHLTAPGVSSQQQRYELEMLQRMNRQHALRNDFDPKFEARIKSFELAFRMQTEAPDVFDVERESKATHQQYGLDEGRTKDFGWQCLVARRLVERGVRFVQCSHSYKWDQHSELARGHYRNARQVDKPIAGLLADLKARGLLEDTLVIWGGEFGRTPFAQHDGRDHNPYGYTIWMAGGGVRGGTIYGATDEYGYHAVEDRMHIHDLHATILHLLGLDHERLTYRHGGREFRLTDVHGDVARKIIA